VNKVIAEDTSAYWACRQLPRGMLGLNPHLQASFTKQVLAMHCLFRVGHLTHADAANVFTLISTTCTVGHI